MYSAYTKEHLLNQCHVSQDDLGNVTFKDDDEKENNICDD